MTLRFQRDFVCIRTEFFFFSESICELTAIWKGLKSDVVSKFCKQHYTCCSEDKTEQTGL